MQLSKESAIDKLIKYIKEKQPLTDKEIYKIHETLLYGTSSKDVETIRTKNNTFVAKTINGQKTFDYFPIDFKDANQATKIIATLYNQRLTNKAFDNIFIQPFLIHTYSNNTPFFNPFL